MFINSLRETSIKVPHPLGYFFSGIGTIFQLYLCCRIWIDDENILRYISWTQCKNVSVALTERQLCQLALECLASKSYYYCQKKCFKETELL